METKLIITQLELEFSKMADLAIQMDDSDFFRKVKDEVWSVCEHLQHLTLTMLPVTNLLKQPVVLAERWGHSGRASRSQMVFLADYKAATTWTGWKTLPPFVPKVDTASEQNAQLHSSQNEQIGADFYALTGTQMQGLADKLPSAASTNKADVVALLVSQCKALLSLIATFDDAQMDDLRLPFPYIGLVTLKEMLMLTQYHFASHYARISKN
jgi:DinB superfamily